VSIYVLRHVVADRKRVERLVDPYLFKTSEFNDARAPASLSAAPRTAN
jgi:hypothetical protein